MVAVPTSWSCVPGAVPVSARRGSLQLWQFLIALLDDPANCGAITWTGRGMEFKLIEPEEVRGGGFIRFSVSGRLLFLLKVKRSNIICS